MQNSWNKTRKFPSFSKTSEKVNNSDLKEISKSLGGKNESEIYEILQEKIFVNNDQLQNIE